MAPGTAESATAPSANPPAPLEDTEASPSAAPEPRRRRPSRRVWRWVANILIIAGVCLLAYPLGTWTYTWYEQRQLRDQLEQDHPQLAAAAATALYATDLVEVTPTSPATTVTTAATVTTAPVSGQAPPTTVTTLSPAEERRLIQFATFRKAADDFERALGQATGQPIGRLLIPSIGLDKVILEGAETGDLREGPGHWPETPFPGEVGNFVISGHRTTYGAPFLKLDKINVGDEITVVLPYAIVRYAVTRTVIVGPKDMESVAQLGREQISLAACHPIASARQRIVVQGDMIGFKLIE